MIIGYLDPWGLIRVQFRLSLMFNSYQVGSGVLGFIHCQVL